jgi:hypothetical protein
MAEITLDTVLQAIVESRTVLTGRIDGLEARIDRLEQGQTRLRVELSERMDRLQTGLDALRQGYVVDWANVERATRIANNAFDDTRSLGEQVMQLTKLVHMLEAQIRDLRGDG